MLYTVLPLGTAIARGVPRSRRRKGIVPFGPLRDGGWASALAHELAAQRGA